MMRLRLLAACAALALLAGPVTAQQSGQPKSDKAQAGTSSSETYRQLNLFGEVFERVRAD